MNNYKVKYIVPAGISPPFIIIIDSLYTMSN